VVRRWRSRAQAPKLALPRVGRQHVPAAVRCAEASHSALPEVGSILEAYSFDGAFLHGFVKKRAIRMTRTKPPENREKFTIFVAYTFRRNTKLVSPRDISTIEYMIRQGTKQLEMYENPALRDCFLTDEMAKWAQDNQGTIVAMQRSSH